LATENDWITTDLGVFVWAANGKSTPCSAETKATVYTP